MRKAYSQSLSRGFLQKKRNYSISVIFIAVFLIWTLPGAAQVKQEKVDGYAEYYKNNFLIVEGQRISANSFTKFKKVSNLQSIPLGYAVEVKGMRQENGSILATEVEAKPNGTALFEPEALKMTGDAETFWMNNGAVLEPQADGTVANRGVIISEGAQVDRVRNIMMRLLPSYVSAEKIRLRVVENDEWNASAMANGAIWVHTSLLRDMSDDEIAMILGHELAHYTHEHTRQQLKRAMWLNLAGTAVQAATKNAQLLQTAALTLSALRTGYSREQEDQADRVGMRYAYEAGFDVSKGYRVWQRFLQKYGEKDKSTNFFTGTHSLPSDRLRNLQQESSINYNGRSDSPTVSGIGLRKSGEIDYRGEWVAKIPGVESHKGTWVITIKSNGEVTGTEYDLTSKASGDIKGYMDQNGSLRLLLSYPAESGTVRGTLDRQGERLVGSLVQYSGDKAVAYVDIILTRQ
jgi:hypothetical protein